MIKIYLDKEDFIELPDYESVYKWLDKYKGRYLSIIFNNETTDETVTQIITRILRVDEFFIQRGKHLLFPCTYIYTFKTGFPIDGNSPNYLLIDKQHTNHNDIIMYIGNFKPLQFLLSLKLNYIINDKGSMYDLHVNDICLLLRKEDIKYLTIPQRLFLYGFRIIILIKNIDRSKLSTNMVKELIKIID